MSSRANAATPGATAPPLVPSGGGSTASNAKAERQAAKKLADTQLRIAEIQAETQRLKENLVDGDALELGDEDGGTDDRHAVEDQRVLLDVDGSGQREAVPVHVKRRTGSDCGVCGTRARCLDGGTWSVGATEVRKLSGLLTNGRVRQER